MARGRPIPLLQLSREERETLERWSRRHTTAQALALRCRIVLACAAEQYGGGWASAGDHADGGQVAAGDEPRPGAPRQIGDAAVEQVLTWTLEKRPHDATHGSTRSMAKRCGLSQSAVSRIWRAFALQPHRAETFQLSKDPLFIEKVRDIVGLYLNPPTRPWCCASMKRRRSRRWTARSRFCQCARAKRSGAPMTTCGTEPPRCSRRWR